MAKKLKEAEYKRQKAESKMEDTKEKVDTLQNTLSTMKNTHKVEMEAARLQALNDARHVAKMPSKYSMASFVGDEDQENNGQIGNLLSD